MIVIKNKKRQGFMDEIRAPENKLYFQIKGACLIIIGSLMIVVGGIIVSTVILKGLGVIPTKI